MSTSSFNASNIQWERYKGKHFSFGSSLPWAQIVRQTNEGKRIAKYHKLLSEQQIREYELECVRSEARNEIVPFPKPHVRAFWMRVAGLEFRVGASLGQETDYIYVEWHNTGAVHGRPMTPAELVRKGANLQ